MKVFAQSGAGTVQSALVLAAGNGDRFKNGSGDSKLLQPVLGQPLILRTLQAACAAGLTTIHVVLGYRASAVRAIIEEGRPAGVAIHFLQNPDWHLENGVSVLTARRPLHNRRFALLMGDHVFEPPVLARLLRTPTEPGASLLAVDSRPASPAIVAEATKVRLAGTRITAIGKQLSPHHALDTGMFVCDPSLFDALEEAVAAGDTTLSGGIRSLADKGVMRALDIGSAAWFDIDTLDDLATAESQMTTAGAHVV